MEQGFLMVYSDILFQETLVRNLEESRGDILLVIDNSYSYYKTGIRKPRIELVITRRDPGLRHRLLKPSENEILRIGCSLSPQAATHEFVGIASFTRRGAEILREVYHDSKRKYAGAPFQEAVTFEQAGFTDILQEIIQRGFPVHALEVHKGWIELQSRADYENALEVLE